MWGTQHSAAPATYICREVRVKVIWHSTNINILAAGKLIIHSWECVCFCEARWQSRLAMLYAYSCGGNMPLCRMRAPHYRPHIHPSVTNTEICAAHVVARPRECAADFNSRGVCVCVRMIHALALYMLRSTRCARI